MLARLKRFIASTTIKSSEAASLPEAPPVETSIDPVMLDAHWSGWFLTATGELMHGFKICSGERVIDVGCGEGAFAQFCAKQGADLTFVDIDPAMVAQTERLLQDTAASRLQGIVSDASPLPLTDAQFDKVVCTEVIEHVDHPAAFLQELVRVGKPGALYLLSVPDPTSEAVQKAVAPPLYFEKPYHIHQFSRETFDQLVTEAGLVIIDKRFSGFYWSIFWSFFWSCEQDLSAPQHPLLASWTNTWGLMLQTKDGARIKQALDQVMPKSQIVIARKPL